MVLPNQLTVLRIILTPIFIFFFLTDKQWYPEISLGIFLIAALTDWYDGWLARKFNYFTSWGKFWDPMADKILTGGAFISLAYLGILEVWMVVLIMLRDFVVTTVRGLADSKNISFPTSIYAKWKTFIQMVFLYYLLIFFTLSKNEYIYGQFGEILKTLLNPTLIYFVMLGITFITVHSGYLYLKQNSSTVKKVFQD